MSALLDETQRLRKSLQLVGVILDEARGSTNGQPNGRHIVDALLVDALAEIEAAIAPWEVPGRPPGWWVR